MQYFFDMHEHDVPTVIKLLLCVLLACIVGYHLGSSQAKEQLHSNAVVNKKLVHQQAREGML